jgi:hypothetical protein
MCQVFSWFQPPHLGSNLLKERRCPRLPGQRSLGGAWGKFIEQDQHKGDSHPHIRLGIILICRRFKIRYLTDKPKANNSMHLDVSHGGKRSFQTPLCGKDMVRPASKSAAEPPWTSNSVATITPRIVTVAYFIAKEQLSAMVSDGQPWLNLPCSTTKKQEYFVVRDQVPFHEIDHGN